MSDFSQKYEIEKCVYNYFTVGNTVFVQNPRFFDFKNIT